MDKTFSRALISGATGFVGTHLTERLVQMGIECHLLLRKDSALKISASLSNTHQEIYDGTTESVMSAVRRSKPDVVFHLASLFLAQHDESQVTDLISSNIILPTQLVEAMCRLGHKRLINTGTAWQHFQGEAYNPVCLYAATKQAFEDLCAYYVKAQELSVYTLKLFDTYGPNDPRKKIIPLLIDRATNPGPTLKLSPGEQRLDFVYIDDVVDAYISAAKQLLSGKLGASQSFGVSSGKTMTLKEIVATFESVVGKKLDVAWGSLPYRDREIMNPWRDFATIPGWKPKMSFEDGLRKIVNR